MLNIGIGSQMPALSLFSIDLARLLKVEALLGRAINNKNMRRIADWMPEAATSQGRDETRWFDTGQYRRVYAGSVV
jgi:hypothetical protein